MGKDIEAGAYYDEMDRQFGDPNVQLGADQLEVHESETGLGAHPEHHDKSLGDYLRESRKAKVTLFKRPPHNID